ncbi:unnamed protein product [Spirodela intermedia]|uniref:Uncharacterized protein n=1 Tax=Spirodela intermedia TaxID=51605 RepID=A0A7I8KKP9_SPIIN|nr:unnamed protein product [Spirodela intermedia]
MTSHSGGSSCSVHGLEGSPWTRTTSMKWVVKSSPAAVTRQSGKTATLRLSGGCYPTKRNWMEVGHVKRRLFITSVFFSRVYDHSLPHNQLATSDVEGE